MNDAIKTLLTTIAKFAPLIASVIPLPGASIIGQIVASAFGGDIQQPAQLNEIISRDPQAEIILKEIEANLQVQLQTIASTNLANNLTNELLSKKAILDNQLSLTESDRLDRANARELAKGTTLTARMPAIITILVATGFFILLFLMLFVRLDPQAQSTNVLYLMFGTLSSTFASCSAFWLGANASSKQKDEVLTSALTSNTSAADTARDVKSTLLETGAVSDKKLSDIHTLVNSNMGVQLRINSVLSARVADLTGLQADKDVALQAKNAYLDHEKQQAIVDAGKAK